MRLVPLGDSGLLVSRAGLGCNQLGSRLDPVKTRGVVAAALDAGIAHFDTADMSTGDGESERLLGEMLRGRRDQVVLATKFGGDVRFGDAVARGSRPYLKGRSRRRSGASGPTTSTSTTTTCPTA